MNLHQRLRLAINILRGRVALNNASASCAKEHVEAGQVRVKKAEYETLLSGNTELAVLRGATATLDPPKFAQVREIVNQTIQNVQKSE